MYIIKEKVPWVLNIFKVTNNNLIGEVNIHLFYYVLYYFIFLSNFTNIFVFLSEKFKKLFLL